MTPVRAPRVMLTVREVAGALHIGERTLYRLLDSGDLASYRVAGTRRIDQADVDRYLEARKEPTLKG